MAYIDFDGAHVLDAAETIGPNEALDDTFLRGHCPSVTEAMDRVTAWLGHIQDTAAATKHDGHAVSASTLYPATVSP